MIRSILAIVDASRPNTKSQQASQQRQTVPLCGDIAITVNVQKAPQQTLRISQGVSQGLIIKRVQPIYPPQARQMRTEGTVELQANISQTGSINGIKQTSGDAMLGRAAMDAVRQWKYKPYYLNGVPIEIQTQITVNFKLP